MINGPSGFTVNVVDSTGQVLTNPIINGNLPFINGAIVGTLTISSNQLTITPPAGTSKGLIISQSLSGTASLAPTFTYPANSVIINSDNTATQPNQWLTGFDVEHSFGGTRVNNGRDAIHAELYLTAPTSATNSYRYYAGINSLAKINSDDNGTIGTPAGNIYGIGTTVQVAGAVKYWQGVFGYEADIACLAGSGVRTKAGIGVVCFSSDAVSGSYIDTAYIASNNAGAVGWTFGLQFTDAYGAFPIKSTGTLWKSENGSVTTGINFNTMAIAGNVLQWAAGSYYLAGTGDFALRSGTFTTGANTAILIDRWGGDSTYNALSLNGTVANGAMDGLVAGNGGGDPALYLMSIGNIIIRPNGVTTSPYTITSTTFDFTGTSTFLSATAIPAGGTTGSGIKFSSTANYGVFFGSGAPTLSAAKGSLYLRSDGSTTTSRAYINTNGSTTWTALTTVA